MNIYNRLPTDIRDKMFQYFSHPVADLVKSYYRPPHIKNLLEDIRDYPVTLYKLYLNPPDHILLNNLWIYNEQCLGGYYIIWQRMFSINSERKAKLWIGNNYATRQVKFKINCLWRLYTPTERKHILKNLYRSESM